MPAGPLNAPSSLVPSVKTEDDDFEPDKHWKENLRKNIQKSSQAMVDAKARQVAELEKNIDSAEDRLRLENEYEEQMADIKRWARGTYYTELIEEVKLRRFLAGEPSRAAVSDTLSHSFWSLSNQTEPRIGNWPQTVVDMAKGIQVAELEKNVLSAEDRLRLENEYKEEMTDIKRRARETDYTEFIKEANLRHLLAGAPLRNGWSEIFSQEQRDIMNSIKQAGNEKREEDREEEERRREDEKKRQDEDSKLKGTTPSSAANKPSPGTSASGKPSMRSVGPGIYPASVLNLEKARLQDNLLKEKLRREYENKEAQRQLRSGNRQTREEVQDVFKQHEILYARLSKINDLTWNDLPWPLLRPPSTPDDISEALVAAYFKSPWWPENDRAKTVKDRLKKHSRRWHPDQFEVRTLPRVAENEREKVELGAGIIFRNLNTLLKNEHENGGSFNIFGEEIST